MAAQKNAVTLSVSEGSRMAAHGVLFTGFFIAVLLRMTGGDGMLRTLQTEPSSGGFTNHRGIFLFYFP